MDLSGASDSSAAVADLLESFPVFERLPPEVSRRLARGHEYRSMSPGDTVATRGTRVAFLYCVLSGLVKLSVSGGRQKERIIDLVGPGQTFCMASLFLDLPCPLSAVVLEPGRLLLLRRGSVLDAVQSSPVLSLRMLGKLSWKLYQRVQQAETDSVTSSAERVIHWLLSRLGSTADDSQLTLDISKKTLAASLNVTPETLSRVLRHLRDTGVIDVHRREIVVRDPRRLRHLRPKVFAASPADAALCLLESEVVPDDVDVPHWLDGAGHDGLGNGE